MKCARLALWFSTVTLACVSAHASARTPVYTSAQEEATNSVQSNASDLARQLRSREPLERQRAAEELARLAATEQRRLVEGYRLQENNSRVRLALDWALYRMGKREALFAIVRALETARSNQAQAYLSELESAEPLYLFLERAEGRRQIRLLEVLARIGDRVTLERIKPLVASPTPGVAEAARFAEREITLRLTQTPPAPTPTRPRQVGKSDETSP